MVEQYPERGDRTGDRRCREPRTRDGQRRSPAIATTKGASRLLATFAYSLKDMQEPS